ncbi:MAG: hypothetical protein U5J99_00945 [Parvularculaceae bacterium]|nr:hypothetical protein [Parvularculaceae bacterium]
MSMMRAGLEILGGMDARAESVLTPEACAFVADLVDAFAAERAGLLAARRRWQAKIDAGALPDFRADTKAIRDSDWKVGPLPPDLLDRRVEITGPVSAKMIINALNADVKVFMADFEDALCPSWANVIDGQINLKDAIRRTLSYADPATGKTYALNAHPATLIAARSGAPSRRKARPAPWRAPSGRAVRFRALFFP